LLIIRMSKSTKGWNWGQYELKSDAMEFTVESKPCFTIAYKDIALASANGANEVAFEFAGEAE
jgi:structure-specific recognition protein 1